MWAQFNPRATRWPGVPGIAVVLAGVLSAGTASAAPWRPPSDTQLLEALPSATSARALGQAALAVRGGDLTVTVRLARAYIERSRQEGDPRLLGYADGLLGPWESAQPV